MLALAIVLTLLFLIALMFMLGASRRAAEADKISEKYYQSQLLRKG
jgi:hypothetical protein